MKNKIFALMLCLSLFLTGCGGKEPENPEVPTEAANVNIIADDDTLDPENTELETNEGSEVVVQQIEKKEGKANGIDVSKWQGKIDWARVKNSGIDFAIIRIGYRGEDGVIYRDANADYNIQQATERGIPIGVYFFSTAISVEEAKSEAAWVKEAVAGYKISYPVVYDCEGYNKSGSRMYSLSATQRTDNALSFLKAIKTAGYEGMFYASKNELQNITSWEIARIENKFKVWVAQYPEVTYPEVLTPDYTGKYDMWQYTNRGKVDGIEGNCDLIVSYFVSEVKDAVDTSKTPTTAKPPKTKEELSYTELTEQVTAKEIVNLRRGPSTKYDIVGTLKSGEFITRTGSSSSGWSRLLYNGEIVYAISSYLSTEVINVPKKDIVNGAEFTPCEDRVTAKNEVNLRALPTTNSESVGKLKSGTFLPRTATGSNGWSRLDYNGQTVYAVTSYLTTTAPENNPEPPESEEKFTEYGMEFTVVSGNFTAKEETNLRDKPSTTDSTVIYTLKNGEYIEKVAESKSGWSKLIYNGQTVYAISSFLTK